MEHKYAHKLEAAAVQEMCTLNKSKTGAGQDVQAYKL